MNLSALGVSPSVGVYVQKFEHAHSVSRAGVPVNQQSHCLVCLLAVVNADQFTGRHAPAPVQRFAPFFPGTVDKTFFSSALSVSRSALVVMASSLDWTTVTIARACAGENPAASGDCAAVSVSSILAILPSLLPSQSLARVANLDEILPALDDLLEGFPSVSPPGSDLDGASDQHLSELTSVAQEDAENLHPSSVP